MFRTIRYISTASILLLLFYMNAFAVADETQPALQMLSKLRTPENFKVLPDGRVFACVQLSAAPTAEVFIDRLKAAGAKAADSGVVSAARHLAMAQLKTVQSQQRDFLSAMQNKKSADWAVIYSMQRLFNGVVIRSTRDEQIGRASCRERV